ncbi:MAG: sulfotransferase [Gammaproteobacteria bacterium]|nr:sulfotransferase [Gammaproteobacteria bacterium]
MAASQELAADPDIIDSLYAKAVAERYLKHHKDALETLQRLQGLSPGYARAWQEEGHNHRDLGDLDEARRAYQRAIELNRALTASWRELAKIHHAQRDEKLYKVAKAEFERLSDLPPELVTVTSLIQENRLYRAERLCREFLKKTPHHVEAMRLLANLGMKLYVYDDAEFLLESCVELRPDYWLARLDYVAVLHKRQKFEKALQQATYLRENYPGNDVFDLTYANQSVAVGDYDQALSIYDRVIAKNPDFSQAWLTRGHALKTVGRVDEGVESYRAAYRTRPDYGDAYWSLANLKTYRFGDDEIADMRRLIERPETATGDRFHLCFALGKALEDREQFEDSFSYYERGNKLRLSGLRYDPERLPLAMRRQIEICDEKLLREKAGFGSFYSDPIFIVGLPRAGSTLLEQILASHSEIDGTMELPNIIATAHRLNGRTLVSDEANYPKILHDLDDKHFKKLADAYINDTKIHRKGAPKFIDKMPNNFMHVGLIHLMFPNAKIIDARRHPMACCFSGFKQLFADGQEFTYSLDDIASYYKNYVALMRHWDKVLPAKVHRVHYENVVADAENEVKKLLDFIGVPFEKSCLDFYKTDRSIRTPSSEQVRQPIYKSGLEQWRNFEPFLGALKTSLEDEIAAYPA